MKPQEGGGVTAVPASVNDRQLLEHLLKTVTTVAIKIDHMYERLADHRQLTYDHEQRLRLLEQHLPGKPERADVEARFRLLEDSMTTIKASRGTATWLWQAAIALVAVTISVLGYLNMTGGVPS